jgi:hypothetical protein
MVATFLLDRSAPQQLSATAPQPDRVQSQTFVLSLQEHLNKSDDYFLVSRLLCAHGRYLAGLYARNIGREIDLLNESTGQLDNFLRRVRSLIDLGDVSAAHVALSEFDHNVPALDKIRLSVALLAGRDVRQLAERVGTWSDEFASDLNNNPVTLCGTSTTDHDIERAAWSGHTLAVIKRMDVPRTTSLKILYLNSLASQSIIRTRHRDATKQSLAHWNWVVGRFGPTASLPVRTRRMKYRNSTLFRPPPIGTRCISDLLIAGARELHLVGFDLYTTKKNKLSTHAIQGYQQILGGRSYGSSRWACLAHSSHDLFSQFNFFQFLVKSHRISPDARLAVVLAAGVESYAEELEMTYAH